MPTEPLTFSSDPLALADAEALREANERLVIATVRAEESSEAAQRHHARLQALIGALHDGAVIVDGAGAVVMMNDAARSMFGVDAEGGARERLERLALRHPDGTPLGPAEHPLRRALEDAAFTSTELWLTHPDGHVAELVMSGTRILEGSSVVLAMLIVRDVTAHRLLEKRLVDAEHLATIGVLARGMAHEINNPLACVLANAEYTTEVLAVEEAALRALGGAPLEGIANRLQKLSGVLGELREATTRIHDIVRQLETFAGVYATNPAAEAAEPTTQAAPPPVTGGGAPSAVVGANRPRVLVIDDEQSVGRAISRMLEKTAAPIHLRDAREALARIAAGESFDVIFCDLMMPHMTGIEFFRELGKAYPGLAERVVFYTGGAFTDESGAFLAATRNLVLEKPIDGGKLRGAIDDVLLRSILPLQGTP